MGSKIAQILLLALTAGLRSANAVVPAKGLHKGLLVGGIVAAVTAGDALYSAHISTIDNAKVTSFTADCTKVAGNKVIKTVDASKISVLKLECVKDTGQDDLVVQDTGVANWIISNANLLLN